MYPGDGGTPKRPKKSLYDSESGKTPTKMADIEARDDVTSLLREVNKGRKT